MSPSERAWCYFVVLGGLAALVLAVAGIVTTISALLQ